MNNEVVKKPVPKAFFKKVYRYRQFLIMLAPAVIYTLVFAYYPMAGVVLAFKSIMPAVSGEVHGTDLKFRFLFKSGQVWLNEKYGIGNIILFLLL